MTLASAHHAPTSPLRVSEPVNPDHICLAKSAGHSAAAIRAVRVRGLVAVRDDRLARVAEALKDKFGVDIPRRIAAMIVAVHPAFPVEAFVADSLDAFEELELTARARLIAEAMAAHLPADRSRALEILTESLTIEPDVTDLESMAGFVYLPHTYFVAAHGLDHFEAAMTAQYELTQCFTAEFSIRAYLVHHPTATLARLRLWASDPNVHVRRLVSEGTRPRLPWASRLLMFQEDPGPVIELLELLKDDDEEYVRRSVANNLNDIAKDHPATVVELAARWWADGDRNRKRLIRHGLRTLVKQGDASALAVLGYGADTPAAVRSTTMEPAVVPIGERVRISVEIENPSDREAGVLVDLRIHFVKANGSTSPKVFKGSEMEIEPRSSATVRKTVSIAQHSTRTHAPGLHRVEVLINGTVHDGGAFTVTLS